MPGRRELRPKRDPKPTAASLLSKEQARPRKKAIQASNKLQQAVGAEGSVQSSADAPPSQGERSIAAAREAIVESSSGQDLPPHTPKKDQTKVRGKMGRFERNRASQ